MLLVVALSLFFLVHVIPFRPEFRERLINKLGPKRYKLFFRLTIISIVTLLIVSWKHFPNIYFYEPSILLKQIHILVMLPVVFFWVIAEVPNNFKRYIRHPMLTGVQIATISHLIANGDLRSIIVFISFFLFSTWSIWASNRRDANVKCKPTKVSKKRDAICVLLTIIIYSMVFWGHGFLFGVPVYQYIL